MNPLRTKADLNDLNTIEYPWPKRSDDRIEESLPMSCLPKLTQSGHQSTLVLSLVAPAGGAAEFERIDPSYHLTDANSLIDIDSHKDHMISAESLKIVFMNEGL